MEASHDGMQTDFSPATLPDKFLHKLVGELDDETVRAIIFHGSYARGEAMPPYSDVDLVRIVHEGPDVREQKRFLARDSYLLSISTRPLSVYHQRITLPETAIFVVPGIQEASDPVGGTCQSDRRCSSKETRTKGPFI